MARPNKIGLEYFPLDVDCDDAVKLIDAKFGVVGFGILIKLWQIIYDNGYYIKWTERELLLYRNRINADINLINDVINESVKWGLFNEDMFKNNILTSKGIQKRYVEAVRRRSEIFIDMNYWIIDVPNTTERFNVNIIEVNVDINSKNVDDNTQSKVKKSRVDKIESKVCIFGSQKNVKLTSEELSALNKEYPYDTENAIEYLSLYIAEKGDKSKAKTHNLTIRRWVINAVRENRKKQSYTSYQKSNNDTLPTSDKVRRIMELDDEE